MNFRNVIVLLMLLFMALPVYAQVLTVSEEEQLLLGIEVQTVTAREQSGVGEITMRVAFAPDGEWAIKTPLSGILHRVFVQQGDIVKQGDPLVIVRSADMVALQRDYLKARTEFNLQASVYKREKKLRDAGSLSDRRWQETLFRHGTAKAEYAGLRGQMMLAGFSEPDMQKLADTMEVGPDIILRSPADAVVLERPAMLGDHLDGRELLVRLGEPGKLVLEGYLSKAAADRLGVGGQIVLPEDGARAELVLVSGVIDPQTQTVHVRAEPSDISSLKPGQLNRWEVLSAGFLIIVPSSAVVKLEGKDVAYVSVPSGFETREVQVSGTGSGTWVVTGGLEPGDRVAINGTAILKGMSMGMGGGDK